MKVLDFWRAHHVTNLEAWRQEQLQLPAGRLAAQEKRIMRDHDGITVSRNRIDGINTVAYRGIANYLQKGFIPEGISGEDEYRQTAAEQLTMACGNLLDLNPHILTRVVRINGDYWQKVSGLTRSDNLE